MSLRLRVLLGMVIALAAARTLLAVVADAPLALELPVASYDPAQVQRIVLRRATQSAVAELTLERASDSKTGWVVASHGRIPALARAPDALLERIASWRRQRLVGDDPARHADWQVAETRGRRVRLEGASGAVLADLLVGLPSGIDRDAVKHLGGRVETEKLGLLVRPAGGDAVFEVIDFLTRELEPSPRFWFLRPLLDGSRDDVTRLTVTRTEGALTLIVDGQGPGRFEGDPRPPDPHAAFGLLTWLYALEAIGPGPSDPPPADATRFTIACRGLEAPQQVAIWSRDARWFMTLDGFTVEVPAFDAKRLYATRLEALVRTRLIALGGSNLRRAHWLPTSGEEVSLIRRLGIPERSLGRSPSIGPPTPEQLAIDHSFVAVVTGAQRPLAWAIHPLNDLRPLAERLTTIEVKRWATEEEVADALSRPLGRLLLHGRDADRVELVVGQEQGGLRAVRCDVVPTPAWLDERALQSLLRDLRALVPE